MKISFGIEDALKDAQIDQMVSDANEYTDSIIKLHGDINNIVGYEGMASSIATLHFESAYRRRVNFSETLSVSIADRLKYEVKILVDSLRRNTRKTSDIHVTDNEGELTKLIGQTRGILDS